MTAEIKSSMQQVPGKEVVRESEEKYRRIIDTANEGIMMGGLDGRITFANKKISDMLGYSIDELVGKIGLDFMPKDQKEKVIAARKELTKKNNIQIEVCFLRKDGSRLWTIGSYAPITDHTGEHTGNLAMYTDITERKKTEQALRESEERYHNLFSTMDEGFSIIEMIFDKEGRPADYRFLEVNTAFEKQTGLHGAEGKLMRELAPAHEAYWFEIYGKIALTGEPARFVNEAKALNRWFEVYAYRIGKPEDRHVAIVFNDISEFKRAEAALRESETKFSTMFRAAPIGMSLAAIPDGTLYDINQGWLDMTGYTQKDEVVGKTSESLGLMPEAQQRVHILEEFKKNGYVRNAEMEFRTKSGVRRNILVSMDAVEINGRKFILSTNQDITERKRVETALLEATTQKQVAQYSRNLLETSLDPLVTISAEGKITDANHAAVSATGVAKQDLIGTDFSSYFTEQEKADHGYRQVFERGSVTDYPLTIRHKNGSIMHVLYNAAVYKDEGGNVLGVFAAARDVTARKRAEEELAAHQRRLEELVAARTAELEAANKDLRGSRRAALNLLKDAMEARRAVEQAEEGLRLAAQDLSRSNKDLEQFAYVASHDLQEPLRAVGGFMGLLKNQYYDKLDDQAREYIDFAVDGAERMQGLIEGLLAFSRVGTRGGEFAPVNLNDALERALANLRTLVDESHAVVSSDTLPVVTADLVQMTQILQNLVANAVKFHGPRSPEIHVGAQRNKNAWEIYVRDNGIGIDPQYFDRIFLIFQRLHTRTQYKGTGIGLAVCKKIVERHGGRIWVESVPGNGSTFYFTIPDKGGVA
jgi:PAS domain S-box-containing protein